MSLTTLVTLFPLDFVAGDTVMRLEGALFEQGLPGRWPDVVLNVLLFLPLGALLHSKKRDGAHTLTPILIGAATTSAVLSSSVEVAQLFLPSRFPSVLDIASNVTGALAGVYVHSRFEARAARLIVAFRRRVSPAVVPLLGFAAAALVVSGALQSRTRVSNWDDGYPLLIGNEATGDRPWRGRVYSLEVTDTFTPSDTLWRLARGDSVEVPGRRLASVVFEGAAPYDDMSGHLPVLDWTDPGYTSDPSSAVIGQAWLRTEGSASPIVRPLRASGAFTIRLRCATADSGQSGPARIVSNSIDPTLRNVTIGQSGTGLVVRVRTPLTGLNGSNPEFIVPGVFSSTAARDVLVSYDGARLRVAVAGSGIVRGFSMGPGSSAAVAWNPVMSATDLRLYNLAYVSLLFAPPGIFFGILDLTQKRRSAYGVLWVSTFALLFEVVVNGVSGAPFDWRDLATNAALGAAVLTGSISVVTALIPAVPGCEK